MSYGTLYLIPVPLAEGTSNSVLPAAQTALINNIKHFIVENERTARRWLRDMGLQTPQSELHIQVYGKHSEKDSLSAYLNPLKAGESVGLMSEAGCPGIADPGAEIVDAAHRSNIRVVPLVGPSSILLALMASGFNGQSFAFHGYLPIDKVQRSKRIKELEGFAERYSQTQIFMETPFRNNQLLEEVLRTCNPQSRLTIAVNITAENESIRTLTIAEWKKAKADLHKQPAIFVLYKKA